MRRVLESQQNLEIMESIVEELLVEDGIVTGANHVGKREVLTRHPDGV